MDSGRWERLKEVFSHAIEVEPERRGLYVAEACGADSKLRAAVERLLREHIEAESAPIFSERFEPSMKAGSMVGGRYRIASFLGRGGMGEVYRAKDTGRGGVVALKMLRPELAEDAQFVARFRREAHLARRVTHRNVCRILDVGGEGNGRSRAYLAMEFLDGGLLADRLIERGAMREEEALPIIEGMAAGLSALHEQGIVHRDIKPGNVMLVRDDDGGERAVIGDLGSAIGERLLNSSLISITKSGTVLGTPDYMAPEQLTGRRVTAAADIYSFGLVIYEMVAGKKAFGGGLGLESAARRLTDDPVPPRHWAPGLRQEWEEVIVGCLVREPARRPGTAFGVVEKLLASR